MLPVLLLSSVQTAVALNLQMLRVAVGPAWATDPKLDRGEGLWVRISIVRRAGVWSRSDCGTLSPGEVPPLLCSEGGRVKTGALGMVQMPLHFLTLCCGASVF